MSLLLAWIGWKTKHATDSDGLVAEVPVSAQLVKNIIALTVTSLTACRIRFPRCLIVDLLLALPGVMLTGFEGDTRLSERRQHNSEQFKDDLHQLPPIVFFAVTRPTIAMMAARP